MTTNESRPSLPPFALESATGKVRLTEDGWNSRNPGKVVLDCTPDSEWHIRAEFMHGPRVPAMHAVNSATGPWLSHQLNVASLFRPSHAPSVPCDRGGKPDGIQRGENMNDFFGIEDLLAQVYEDALYAPIPT